MVIERLGQGGQRLRALGLGGLDHERLVDDQREVHGRCVEALLQEALGHVEGAYPLGLLQVAGRRHELVHVRPVEGQVVGTPQPMAQPVGVEDGSLGDPAQPVAPVGQDVGQARASDQGVAVPAVDPADRLLRRRRPSRTPPSGVGVGPAARAGTRPGGARRPPGRPPGLRRRAVWRRSCAGSCARCRSPCRRGG